MSQKEIKSLQNQGIVVNNPEGKIIFRSEGRAYWSYETRIESFDELSRAFHELQSEANESGRRRVVLRCRCTQEVVDQLIESNLPREVIIPLDTIWPGNTDYLVILGENVHQSDVDEWESVYQYWQSPNGSKKSPIDRVEHATNAEGFELTNTLTEADALRLSQIWQPFGWTPQGTTSFINNYQTNPDLWFSGLRDPQTGELVSACEAELAQFAGINLIEGTEYGTLPGYEGLGLCTAAVTALHAQVLKDTFYQTGQAPLIFAEFNMTSRSDIVGRHAGITIPLVENTPGLESTPIQVMRRNVSVLDRHTPNSLSYYDLGENRKNYRDAYRAYYRYWRNFIVGILPIEAIETHYSQENINKVLSKLG